MFRAIHQSRYCCNYCIVAWELWVPCFMEALHSISWIHNSTILHLDIKMNSYRILFLHHIAIYIVLRLYICVLWVVLKLKTKLISMINCCLHLYSCILVTFHVMATIKVHTNWFWVVLKPSRRTISIRAMHY